MVQTIKQYLTIAVTSILLTVSMSVALSATIYAEGPPPTSDLQKGVNCGSKLQLANDPTCSGTPDQAASSLNSLISDIINIFSAIVGAVSVIMIIVGGFRYITSGGDSNNVGGAKNTILYAIVGLIIVAFAQIIVRFVLQSTT